MSEQSVIVALVGSGAPNCTRRNSVPPPAEERPNALDRLSLRGAEQIRAQVGEDEDDVRTLPTAGQHFPGTDNARDDTGRTAFGDLCVRDGRLDRLAFARERDRACYGIRSYDQAHLIPGAEFLQHRFHMSLRLCQCALPVAFSRSPHAHRRVQDDHEIARRRFPQADQWAHHHQHHGQQHGDPQRELDRIYQPHCKPVDPAILRQKADRRHPARRKLLPLDQMQNDRHTRAQRGEQHTGE